MRLRRGEISGEQLTRTAYGTASNGRFQEGKRMPVESKSVFCAEWRNRFCGGKGQRRSVASVEPDRSFSNLSDD
jgi:hypothetical protein